MNTVTYRTKSNTLLVTLVCVVLLISIVGSIAWAASKALDGPNVEECKFLDSQLKNQSLNWRIKNKLSYEYRKKCSYD